jgi:Protein of unknown function (DUF3267).
MGIFKLPEGYSEIKRVNLQKDKKLAIILNVGALIIAVALFIVGGIFVPFSFEISEENLLVSLLKLFGVLVAIVLYLVAHEMVHGIFIKKYSGKKAKYGFTGFYAYAGSDAYFKRPQYIIIALAPVVIFGVIFLLLNIFLPKEYFWPIYFIQIMNLSGAIGDFYITFLVNRLPADILTKDEGFSMIIYSKTK